MSEIKKSVIKTEKETQIKLYDISRPEQVCEMANLLKYYVVKNNLYTEIVGKKFVMIEGWQFAGGLMGLYPKVSKVECLAPNKWFAQADIIQRKDGSVVSSGFALCDKAEMRKKSFDEYALLSMAQTRAISKAYRNLIGWVMKLAGYEATLSEEMREVIINSEKKTLPSELITKATESDINLILKLSSELGKKINLPKELSKVGANKIITALMKLKQEKNGK